MALIWQLNGSKALRHHTASVLRSPGPLTSHFWSTMRQRIEKQFGKGSGEGRLLRWSHVGLPLHIIGSCDKARCWWHSPFNGRQVATLCILYRVLTSVSPPARSASNVGTNCLLVVVAFCYKEYCCLFCFSSFPVLLRCWSAFRFCCMYAILLIVWWKGFCCNLPLLVI